MSSILDIGAGDGKVIKHFQEKNSKIPDCYRTEYFAIEKARPLLDSLPVDVGILGTDFWEQSLLDKPVDCIFSNPPYSEFVDWCVKVIREANSNYIYLVILSGGKSRRRLSTHLISGRLVIRFWASMIFEFGGSASTRQGRLGIYLALPFRI